MKYKIRTVLSGLTLVLAWSANTKEKLCIVVTNVFLDNNVHCFWQYLPRDCCIDREKRYPLLIYMHGNSESSSKSGSTDPAIIGKVNPTSISKLSVNRNFSESFSSNWETFGYLALCPQIKAGLDFNESAHTDSFRPAIMTH